MSNPILSTEASRNAALAFLLADSAASTLLYKHTEGFATAMRLSAGNHNFAFCVMQEDGGIAPLEYLTREEAQTMATEHEAAKAAPVAEEHPAPLTHAEEVAAALATEGLRLASEDEPGWTWRRSINGHHLSLWVTDEPAPADDAFVATPPVEDGDAWEDAPTCEVKGCAKAAEGQRDNHWLCEEHIPAYEWAMRQQRVIDEFLHGTGGCLASCYLCAEEKASVTVAPCSCGAYHEGYTEASPAHDKSCRMYSRELADQEARERARVRYPSDRGMARVRAGMWEDERDSHAHNPYRG